MIKTSECHVTPVFIDRAASSARNERVGIYYAAVLKNKQYDLYAIRLGEPADKRVQFMGWRKKRQHALHQLDVYIATMLDLCRYDIEKESPVLSCRPVEKPRRPQSYCSEVFIDREASKLRGQRIATYFISAATGNRKHALYEVTTGEEPVEIAHDITARRAQIEIDGLSAALRAQHKYDIETEKNSGRKSTRKP